MYNVFIFILLLISFTLPAQDIQPTGGFLSDTIKVGQPVRFTLSAKYLRQRDIVFPDSTYNFAPFEFEKKRYFPTRTDSLISYDSVVYTLTTFEIDTVQYLRLPVFDVSRGDSTIYYTSTDSVILHHVVTEIPDTVKVEDMPLRENTTYLPLSLQFNYPYLIIGIIILIIITLLVIIIFGKRIRKWWKLRRMQKHHNSFLNRYHEIIQNPQLEKEQKAARAVVVWKDYMERLTGYPYRKLTTKEIFKNEHHEPLRMALRQIDRVIYSNRKLDVELDAAYQELENYTELQYNKNVEDLKNG